VSLEVALRILDLAIGAAGKGAQPEDIIRHADAYAAFLKVSAPPELPRSEDEQRFIDAGIAYQVAVGNFYQMPSGTPFPKLDDYLPHGSPWRSQVVLDHMVAKR
jgi:hypothetical protein